MELRNAERNTGSVIPSALHAFEQLNAHHAEDHHEKDEKGQDIGQLASRRYQGRHKSSQACNLASALGGDSG